jgi:hypothetical protein
MRKKMAGKFLLVFCITNMLPYAGKNLHKNSYDMAENAATNPP